MRDKKDRQFFKVVHAPQTRKKITKAHIKGSKHHSRIPHPKLRNSGWKITHGISLEPDVNTTNDSNELLLILNMIIDIFGEENAMNVINTLDK